MKPFLIDFDLHLIKKDLAAQGVPVELDAAVPISANAPDYYRIYFCISRGEIFLGVPEPPAAALVLAMAWHDAAGPIRCYVIRGKRIVGSFKLTAENLLVLTALLSKENLCAASVHRNAQRSLLSAWQDTREKFPNARLPEHCSEKDIVRIFYEDTRGSFF